MHEFSTALTPSSNPTVFAPRTFPQKTHPTRILDLRTEGGSNEETFFRSANHLDIVGRETNR